MLILSGLTPSEVTFSFSSSPVYGWLSSMCFREKCPGHLLPRSQWLQDPNLFQGKGVHVLKGINWECCSEKFLAHLFLSRLLELIFASTSCTLTACAHMRVSLFHSGVWTSEEVIGFVSVAKLRPGVLAQAVKFCTLGARSLLPASCHGGSTSEATFVLLRVS